MKRRTDPTGTRGATLLKLSATATAFFLPIILAAAYVKAGTPPPIPGPPDLTVSKSTGGVAANGTSDWAFVSSDGNTVVFQSTATNLGPVTPTLGTQVFVRDMITKQTTLVSNWQDGFSAGGTITVDGLHVVYWDREFLDPTIGPWTLLVRDLQTGTDEIVGQGYVLLGGGYAAETSASGDAQQIAFRTEQALEPADTNGAWDIYVKDRVPDTLTRVSVPAAGGAYEDVYGPQLSVDAQWIVFNAKEQGVWNVVLKQLSPPGQEFKFPGSARAGSAMDLLGQKVIYTQPGGAVFVFDSTTGTHDLVSVDSLGNPAAGDCGLGVISGDGLSVAFHCEEAMTSHGASEQVYVRDLPQGLTKLASITSTGVPGSFYSIPNSMPFDGSSIVLQTGAFNLHSGGASEQIVRVPSSYWDEGSVCTSDDATCDGVDDDCDGQTDEDYVSQTTNCGQGICAATGTTMCNSGQVVDSCVPGVPAADDPCDGLDNNCDGQIDELYASTASSCFSGGCERAGLLDCVGGQLVDSCATASCSSEVDCEDAIDNDGDAQPDCADSDCAAHAACNSLPSIANVPNATLAIGDVHEIQLVGSDPESAPLTYSVQPATTPNITLDAKLGDFEFHPDFTQTGDHLFTFSVSDGTHVVITQATLTVTTPSPGDPSGIMGYVYDATEAQAGNNVGVENVVVRDVESNLQAITDASGAFVISDPVLITPGLHHIEFDGTNGGDPGTQGFTFGGYLASKVIQEGVVDFIERPVYLPRLDPTLFTMLDPVDDTIVENPALGVSLTIAPGIVKAADGNAYAGPVGVFEVPVGFTPGSLPDLHEPAIVVTIQPMGLTFDSAVPITFPDRDGLPVGEELDLWSLNHATGEFEKTGVGIVADDGAGGTEIQTQSGGIREASWHDPLCPQPGGGDDGNGDGDQDDEDDSDDDGMSDDEECPDPTDCRDSDDDGTPDSGDEDDDNDGTPSGDEDPDGDADGDGNNDPLDANDGPGDGLDGGDDGGGNPGNGGGGSMDDDPDPDPPLPGPGGGGGGPCGGQQDSDPFGSRVIRKTGCLESVVSLPTYRSLNVDRGVQLVYLSDRAFPFPLMPFGSAILQRAAIPNQLSYTLSVGGISVAEEVYIDMSGFDETDGRVPLRPVAGFDARPFTTGTYTVDFRMKSHYGVSRISSSALQKVVVVNETESPLGAGWSVAGVDRLHIQPDGSALLVGGTGYYLHYEPGNTQEATETVLGTANLFRAIDQVPIDYSGCANGFCDGDDPSKILFAAEPGQTMEVVSAEGTVSGWISGCAFVGADGGDPICLTGLTLGANGISGLTHKDLGMHLSGVFLSDDARNDPVPAILDATFAELVQEFYPKLNQTFFIGNGEAANGERQTFHVPAGATKLALGFVGSPGANIQTPTPPGAYTDNGGQLTVAVRLTNEVAGAVVMQGPRYDRTTLVRMQDNTYERTFPNGTVVRFDASGFMTEAEDRFGNTLTYEYDAQGRLERVLDPMHPTVQPTVFSYQGNTVTITDPYNRVTTLELDAQGDLKKVDFPDQSSQEFQYDARHLMTAERDRVGEWTTRTYDAAGRVKEAVRPMNAMRVAASADTIGFVDPASGMGTEGSPAPPAQPDTVQTIVVDAEGRQSVHDMNRFGKAVRTERGGLVSEVRYDRLQRPFVAKAPDGTVTQTLHDWNANRHKETHKQLEAVHGGLATTITERETGGFDRVVSVTTGAGPASISYNDGTNTITYTSAASRQTSQVLNTRGQPCAETDPFGTHWRYDYDARANLSAIVQGVDALACNATALPGARTTQIILAPDGTFLQRINPLGQFTEERYDPLGRPDELEEPENQDSLPRRVTDVDFDPEGQHTRIITPDRQSLPSAQEHVFDYTPLRDLRLYSPPVLAGGGDVSTSYAYNHESQRTGRFEPDGLWETRHYDSVRGDLERVETVRGDYLYEYDPQGMPTGQVDRIITPELDVLTFLYDALYQGTLHTGYQWTGAVSGRVDWTYTFDRRTETESVNAGHTVSLVYEADRLLKTAGALSLTRHPQHGRVSATTLGALTAGSQATSTHAYSIFGELASEAYAWQGSPMYTVSYEGYDPTTNPNPSLGQRDALGRIVRRVESIEGALEVVYEYDYVPGGALREVKRAGLTVEAYTYDENGNRTADLATSGISYDAHDRLTQYGSTTYGYTARGALASKTAPSQETTYHYDVLGNLRKVTLPDNRVIEYVVDAQQRRIGKKVDGVLVQGFLWRNGLRIVAELDGQGNTVSRFVYGERANVPEYMERDSDGNGTMDARYRFIHDQVGSVRLVVDVDTGTVVQSTDYDSFGRVLSTVSEPGFSQPFGFAGGLYDEDTGLVRFGARDYDAEIGRWTTKDPIGFSGGDTNLYAYVGNDPENDIDPRGLVNPALACATPWTAPICGAAAAAAARAAALALAVCLDLILDEAIPDESGVYRRCFLVEQDPHFCYYVCPGDEPYIIPNTTGKCDKEVLI